MAKSNKGWTAIAERNANRTAAVSHRYSKEKYTPARLSKMGEKELRKEYSKARGILKKRYDRAMKADVYTREQADRISKKLVPARGLKGDELVYALSGIARELSRESSTIEGARKRLSDMVETMRNNGYSFINMGNIRDFIDFMDEFTDTEKDALWGSDIMAEYFEEAKQAEDEEELTQEGFYQWIADREGKTLDEIKAEAEKARESENED